MNQIYKWQDLRPSAQIDRSSFFDIDEEEYQLLIFIDNTYAVIKFNDDPDDFWDVVDEDFDIESMSFNTRYTSPRLG